MKMKNKYLHLLGQKTNVVNATTSLNYTVKHREMFRGCMNANVNGNMQQMPQSPHKVAPIQENFT